VVCRHGELQSNEVHTGGFQLENEEVSPRLYSLCAGMTHISSISEQINSCGDVFQ